jgi:DNA-directed RNA polymerase specialized sigma24 family protein
MTQITGGHVEAALIAAATATRAAPKSVSVEAMASAREAWSMLALAPTRQGAGIVEARCRGLAWDAIALRLGVSAAMVRRLHAEALGAIAARLNEAMAP